MRLTCAAVSRGSGGESGPFISRGTPGAASAGPARARATATEARARPMRLSLAAASAGAELVADEVERGDQDDCDRLGDHLVDPERDEAGQQGEVRDVRHEGHDEEAHALPAHVAALAAESPEPVPEVVVRDRDEERARRRGGVVEARTLQERGVDGEV